MKGVSVNRGCQGLHSSPIKTEVKVVSVANTLAYAARRAVDVIFIYQGVVLLVAKEGVKLLLTSSVVITTTVGSAEPEVDRINLIAETDHSAIALCLYTGGLVAKLEVYFGLIS